MDELKTFRPILEQIYLSTRREPKPSLLQIIKLVEEVGELSAEVIKKEGYTYKEFTKKNFYSETSDVIIMIFAFFFKFVEENPDFSFQELMYEMDKKIGKWNKHLNARDYKIIEKQLNEEEQMQAQETCCQGAVA